MDVTSAVYKNLLHWLENLPPTLGSFYEQKTKPCVVFEAFWFF